MTPCWRPILLLTVVLAACSGASTEQDERSSEQPDPSSGAEPGSALDGANESATPSGDEVPAEQRQYFEDGVITLAEYQQAFSEFANCASEAGVGADLREQGRDEVTGLIQYSTQTLLLPPGQSDGSALNECFHRTFAHTETAFQISDPTVLAADAQDQIAFFNENYRSCLQEIGVAIPDDLEFNDENWAQLLEEAVTAQQDGRCSAGVGGG